MQKEIKSPEEILKENGITRLTKYHNYDYLYKKVVESVKKYHDQFQDTQKT